MGKWGRRRVAINDGTASIETCQHVSAMPDHHNSRQGIVADGHERAVRALEPVVRAEVEAEYAERLAAASRWKRARLKQEIRREIERRIAERAPPDALY
jgi:hypothetical protein